MWSMPMPMPMPMSMPMPMPLPMPMPMPMQIMHHQPLRRTTAMHKGHFQRSGVLPAALRGRRKLTCIAVLPDGIILQVSGTACCCLTASRWCPVSFF